jgi:hypothetical protein
MSDDLDVIPVPQLNPASGRMERGWKIKSGRSGGADGSTVCIVIVLVLILALGLAVYWTARKLIALYKRVRVYLRARAEVKRLASLPEGAEPLAVTYPRCADVATRERCEAEAMYDRLRGIR